MLTFRQLPEAEWTRLIDDGVEPFCTHGLPDPDHWILLVAEQDGRIVGVSSLQEAVHNHWHIAPDARRNPFLVLGLWAETKRVLDDRGVEALHTTVADSQVEVQTMIERMGYQPAPGQLYLLPVAECVLNRDEV